MSRRRRLCQYCDGELGWFASLLFWTCKHCAYRMSMGTSPKRRDRTDREAS